MKTIAADASGLAAAVKILQSGGVVAHPTETVWGFAADPTNARAVAKIHALKKTAADKPLLVNLPTKNWLDRIGRKLCRAHALTKKFWPGPLAVVVFLKAAEFEPVAANEKIGVRMSAHPLSNSLAKKFGAPLVTTSANLTGESPARSATELSEIFKRRKNQPDLILDDGSRISKNQPSTLVDTTSENLEILRAGAIAASEIISR